MQKSVLLLAILLVALIGVGAVLFLDTAAPGVEKGGSSVATTGGESKIEGAPKVLPSDLAATPSVKGGGDKKARTSVEIEADSLASTAVASGETITGRVIGANGQPLEGARVVVGGNDPMPLLSEFEAFGGFGMRWSAVSRSDGTFSLTGPEPGEFRIGAVLGGFVFSELENLSLPSGGSLDVGDIALEMSVVLSGRVIVEGGGGVAGAELIVIESGTNRWFARSAAVSAVTDESGYFEVDSLAAGPWEISVKSTDQPTRSFKGRTEYPGESSSGLRFTLEPGLRITGVVTGASESELDGLVISAAPDGGGGRFRMMGGGDESRTAEVQPDGSFVVGGCKVDKEYKLTASRGSSEFSFRGGGNAPTVTEEVAALAGSSGVVLPWIGQTGLEFQVVAAATGQAIENFTVTYGDGWLRAYQVDGEDVVYHPEGRVTLDGLSAGGGGRRGGSFKVAIQAAGFASLEQEFELEEGILLAGGVIGLESVAMVSVTVLDRATGSPVVGANVVLSVGGDGDSFSFSFGGGGRPSGGGSNGSRHTAKSDENGLAVLSSFEGQTGKLVVTQDGYTEWNDDAVAMPVGAPLDLEARLGLGGTVRVTTLDAMGVVLPGARVETRPTVSGETSENGGGGNRSNRMRSTFGGSGDATVADSDGVATFRNLAPGSHEFKLAEQGGIGAIVMRMGSEEADDSWTSIDVVELGEHALTLRQKATSTLIGHVTENGANLAGAVLSLVDPESAIGGFRFPGMTLPGMGTTDGRGDYELSEVEPGSYNLEITHAGRVMKSSFPVDLVVGENRFSVDLSLASVEGQILDGEGDPIEGAKVSVELAESGSQQNFGMMLRGGNGDSVEVGLDRADPSVTNADGRYTLRGVQTNSKLVVKTNVQGLSPGASETFEVSPGETKTDIDMVMFPSGSIAYTLTGESVGNMSLLTATYLDEDGVEPKSDFARGDNGSFEDLRPGRWEIVVRGVGPNGSGDESEPVQVDVRANEETEVVLEF